MSVRQEIMDNSEFTDKPILFWLFDHYHMSSQWRFVAKCKMTKYGKMSYEYKRIWKPTKEGYILYNNREVES